MSGFDPTPSAGDDPTPSAGDESTICIIPRLGSNVDCWGVARVDWDRCCPDTPACVGHVQIFDQSHKVVSPSAGI